MPSAKLSRDVIRSLEPKQAVYEVRDTDLKGLVLRVYPTGRMVYVCNFARGRKVNIGRADALTPSEAREKARRIIADFAKGIDPAVERHKDKTPTLRQLLDDVYPVRAKYRDVDATVKRIKAAFPDLLDKPLDEITPWDVNKWRAQCDRRGVKPETVNRNLNPLKAAMRHAFEWSLIPSNPLAGTPQAKLAKVSKKGRVRYLSADEEKRLRAALDAREDRLRTQRASFNRWRAQRGYDLMPSLDEGFADHVKPIVLLSLNTGMRRGELLSLDWFDLDWERRQLLIRPETTKDEDPRAIPLSREAYELLSVWHEQSGSPSSGYVFPGENGGKLTSVRTAWESKRNGERHGVLADAGIENFRWHDLRHTFASKLVSRGVSLDEVGELLGHADPKMTKVYAHLAPHVLARAVSVLDEPDSGEVVPIAASSRPGG